MIDRKSDFIHAYSEFMPPPRLDNPGGGNTGLPHIWEITEVEEEYELLPGMDNLARQIMDQIIELGRGQAAYLIAGHQRRNLQDNPYWPPELADFAGKLDHEHFPVFLALAFSRTQDDKGRVRWTFFGSSEQGPEKAFWKSFYDSSGAELGMDTVVRFWRGFFRQVYNVSIAGEQDLYDAGFRILPSEIDTRFPYWYQDKLPSWIDRFLWCSAGDTRYLLTFRPFVLLPESVRQKYLAGQLHLIPFPGSLVFWGMPAYITLQLEMPMAMQLPLQRLVRRHNGGNGIKVPQSGWFHEKGSDMRISAVSESLLSPGYRRTHRWERIHRHEDELVSGGIEDTIGRTLFSTDLDVLGLYNKPMARNSQIWTMDSHLLLDGPNAAYGDLKKAALTVARGGSFHYRFQFPPMRMGSYEIFWQRPLCAFRSSSDDKVKMLQAQLAGYLTAYQAENVDLATPIDIHPITLNRELYLKALRCFENLEEHFKHQTSLNIIRIFDAYLLQKRPLSATFARRILKLAEHESLDDWLAAIPRRADNQEDGIELKKELEGVIESISSGSIDVKDPESPITFSYTRERAFEEAWWNDIRTLSTGIYRNKNNADCVQDAVTLEHLKNHRRDLDALGDYLLDRHHQYITRSGMTGRAVCGELSFSWRTDFDFPEYGGWKSDREGHTHDRDLILIIPGNNRKEAVIMADHYDTAFMEDEYDKMRGGTGARVAAPGADDNHSATSTLLQAAPVFLALSRKGLLKRDIWLVHLTGEEYPADCLGSRNLTQALIDNTLQLSLKDDSKVDLSGVSVAGVFVLDMVGHNADFGRDIFQISPGRGSESLYLAELAHQANELWNSEVKKWNRSLPRRGTGKSLRSPDGIQIPQLAEHLNLSGEVRLIEDPHSTLYNTDGQIFSDFGIPVVLFMENYDINRTGYHDTKDIMQNIDLDYGAALAAIVIETVARTAVEDKI